MSKYKVGESYVGLGYGAIIDLDPSLTFDFTITGIEKSGKVHFEYSFRDSRSDMQTLSPWSAPEKTIDEYITRYNVLNSPLMKALG